MIPPGHYGIPREGGRLDLRPSYSQVIDAVRTLLLHCGEDPDREGLKETPKRVAMALAEYCSGYGQDISSMLKTFGDGAAGYDEMISECGIPFYSLCEHHLALFWGEAHVAYVPDGRVVGLSKIPRLINCFSRRLQVQERLTVQIADALMEHLKPKGVGVVLEARHSCMECRGVRTPNVVTRTTALRGVLLEKPEARAEFLRAVGDRKG